MAGHDVRLDPPDAARPQQPDHSTAAAVAYPRPCQGSPITQAITARAPACTVAWTYPTAVPSATRTIQLSHSSRPSTERPTTWRRYCSVSSPRVGGRPPMNEYSSGGQDEHHLLGVGHPQRVEPDRHRTTPPARPRNHPAASRSSASTIVYA